jgi:hypothetical protein
VGTTLAEASRHEKGAAAMPIPLSVPSDLHDVSPLRARASGFGPALAADLVAVLERIDTAPKTITAADQAQQQLLEILAAHQHPSAAFLDVYHGITVAVIAALHAQRLGPAFFFQRLAGRFAERHFDGLKAELGMPTDSDAGRFALWHPSFAFDNLPPSQRLSSGQAPLAHFLVGMCVHINLDLAVALADTMRELGIDARSPLLHDIERGHNFVDTILAEHVAQSIDLLADGMGCPLSRLIRDAGAVPLAADLSMAVIRQWRGKTFPDALRLLAATNEHERAHVREDIYGAGKRMLQLLFDVLPDLMRLTVEPGAQTLLTAMARGLPRPPRALVERLMLVRPPRRVQRLVAAADAPLSALVDRLRQARTLVRMVGLLFRMQMLIEPAA